MVETANQAKKSILIVDDEPELRENLKGLLEQSFPGSLLIESPDGVDAFMRMSRQKFDLVISDLKMPKKDGNQLLQSIAHLHVDLKPRAFMILSGHLDPEYSGKIIKGVCYIAKPFEAEELMSTVKGLLFPAPRSISNPTTQQKVDVTYINPFIDSVLVVLQTTSNTPCKKERLFVRGNDQISGDISAIIAVNGVSSMGSMAISFKKKTFLGIVNRMLGADYTDIDPEISDAAAELCNQVFGLTKTKLNQQGHEIQPAIPSVITGENHQIKHSTSAPVIAVEYSTEFGPFTIEACMAQRAKK